MLDNQLLHRDFLKSSIACCSHLPTSSITPTFPEKVRWVVPGSGSPSLLYITEGRSTGELPAILLRRE